MEVINYKPEYYLCEYNYSGSLTELSKKINLVRNNVYQKHLLDDIIGFVYLRNTSVKLKLFEHDKVNKDIKNGIKNYIKSLNTGFDVICIFRTNIRMKIADIKYYMRDIFEDRRYTIESLKVCVVKNENNITTFGLINL